MRQPLEGNAHATWWHVVIGIQMCFYPVEFVGCFYPVCGWQGIVLRRAHVMASRSCDIMIGALITIEEIIDRIAHEDFFRVWSPSWPIQVLLF